LQCFSTPFNEHRVFYDTLWHEPKPQCPADL